MWALFRKSGPPYFPERNGTERNIPDRKHHLIPQNGPGVKVQLGLQLRSHFKYMQTCHRQMNDYHDKVIIRGAEFQVRGPGQVHGVFQRQIPAPSVFYKHSILHVSRTKNFSHDSFSSPFIQGDFDPWTVLWNKVMFPVRNVTFRSVPFREIWRAARVQSGFRSKQIISIVPKIA